jgi:hypothetical protein
MVEPEDIEGNCKETNEGKKRHWLKMSPVSLKCPQNIELHEVNKK